MANLSSFYLPNSDFQFKARRSSVSIDVQKVLPIAFSKQYLSRYVTATCAFIIMWMIPSQIQIPLEIISCLVVGMYSLHNGCTDFLIMTIMAYIHGVIHYLYPFLNHQGRVKGISPFLDVLCHFVMMVQANRILGFSLRSMVQYDFWFEIHNKWYLTIYRSFLLLSVFNVFAAFILDAEDEGVVEHIFDYSSLSQAISTAYFISAALINPDNCPQSVDSQLLIKYNWIWCILFACCNWGLFRNNHWVMGEAADHGYFQTLFIIPVVIGGISLRPKESKGKRSKDIQGEDAPRINDLRS